MRLVLILLSTALIALMFTWFFTQYYGNAKITPDYQSIDQQVNQVEGQLDQYNQVLEEYQEKTDSAISP